MKFALEDWLLVELSWRLILPASACSYSSIHCVYSFVPNCKNKMYYVMTEWTTIRKYKNDVDDGTINVLVSLHIPVETSKCKSKLLNSSLDTSECLGLLNLIFFVSLKLKEENSSYKCKAVKLYTTKNLDVSKLFQEA